MEQEEVQSKLSRMGARSSQRAVQPLVEPYLPSLPLPCPCLPLALPCMGRDTAQRSVYADMMALPRSTPLLEAHQPGFERDLRRSVGMPRFTRHSCRVLAAGFRRMEAVDVGLPQATVTVLGLELTS
ncbi:hypothetical protein S40285_10442 [Stachybotrys chlorohalonatus IBT 40285]|uniref:Uncharacterized protein n=1 Tax=Stachybotrys chlorohalonatus (strain IBT 40285) TaxID=1283841 RepID=A0A084QJE9_STAC4|nr:hypothetical protein S40285_10442 [Stachybotrys chlorohalonata IBT 40285]